MLRPGPRRAGRFSALGWSGTDPCHEAIFAYTLASILTPEVSGKDPWCSAYKLALALVLVASALWALWF